MAVPAVTLEIFQLQNLLTAASELGAKRALAATGAIKPTMSKAEAYKVHGRGMVDRWIEEGLIKPERDGSSTSKYKLNRMRLEVLAASSNRITYLPVNER